MLVLTLCLAMTLSSGKTAALMPVQLPSDASSGFVSDMSADGQTIVGDVSYPDRTRRAFYWSPTAGCKVLIAKDPKVDLTAIHVSADGSVIGGNQLEANYKTTAFCWSKDSGFTMFPGRTAKYSSSSCSGLSADGKTVLISEWPRGDLNDERYYIRRAGKIVELQAPNVKMEFSAGMLLCEDGKKAFGSIVTDKSQLGFQWNSDGKIQPFKPLSFPLVSNGDGSIVCGIGAGEKNLLWKNGKTIELFPNAPGPNQGITGITGMSADGSVVVGLVAERPVIWTEKSGALDAEKVLEKASLKLPEHAKLTNVIRAATHGNDVLLLLLTGTVKKSEYYWAKLPLSLLTK